MDWRNWNISIISIVFFPSQSKNCNIFPTNTCFIFSSTLNQVILCLFVSHGGILKLCWLFNIPLQLLFSYFRWKGPYWIGPDGGVAFECFLQICFKKINFNYSRVHPFINWNRASISRIVGRSWNQGLNWQSGGCVIIWRLHHITYTPYKCSSFLLPYFLKIVLSFKYDKLKLGFALRYQDSGALQNSHHGSALNCIFCFIFPLHSTIWSALHVHIYYTFQMSKWYFTNIFQKIFSEYYTPLHTLQPTPVQH